MSEILSQYVLGRCVLGRCVLGWQLYCRPVARNKGWQYNCHPNMEVPHV